MENPSPPSLTMQGYDLSLTHFCFSSYGDPRYICTFLMAGMKFRTEAVWEEVVIFVLELRVQSAMAEGTWGSCSHSIWT